MSTQKLIISDPCYLLDSEEWAECCRFLGDDESERHTAFWKKVEEKLRQKDNIKQVVGVANSPYGDGSFFVKILNGTKARELEFCIDSGTWCVCLVGDFNILSDVGIARIEIENSVNLCVEKCASKNRYFIASGNQDIAVIDFDAEIDDDDWEDDWEDD